MFWVLMAVAFIIVAVGTYMATMANANDDNYPSWHENTCVSTGPQCGTDNGTETVTTNPTFTCPEGYTYQNSGDFDQRCHRIVNCGDNDRDGDDEDCPVEHISPTGAFCLEGYTKTGSGEETKCSKTISCHTGKIDNSACEAPSISPTATPTPTVSVTSTQPPSNNQGGQGGGQSNNPPPVAQCGTPFDAPHIVSFTNKDKGTVNFAWTEGQTVDKYSITYGYSPNNLNMGEDNIPGNATNWDIHQLNPGSHVWAQVQAWFNGCEESSNVFDPKVR